MRKNTAELQQRKAQLEELATSTLSQELAA